MSKRLTLVFLVLMYVSWCYAVYPEYNGLFFITQLWAGLSLMLLYVD